MWIKNQSLKQQLPEWPIREFGTMVRDAIYKTRHRCASIEGCHFFVFFLHICLYCLRHGKHLVCSQRPIYQMRIRTYRMTLAFYLIPTRAGRPWPIAIMTISLFGKRKFVVLFLFPLPHGLPFELRPRRCCHCRRHGASRVSRGIKRRLFFAIPTQASSLFKYRWLRCFFLSDFYTHCLMNVMRTPKFKIFVYYFLFYCPDNASCFTSTWSLRSCNRICQVISPLSMWVCVCVWLCVTENAEET